MHSMAFSSGYRKCAAECAKLACDAPSFKARESFSAAAKNWLILATLAEGSMVGEKYQIRPNGSAMTWAHDGRGVAAIRAASQIDEALARTRSRLSASQSLRCEHPVKKEEKND
jgi:hypothetical protein